jgi:formylglycine-generating enzyme
MLSKALLGVLAAAALLTLAVVASAANVTMEMVPVGDPGNAGNPLKCWDYGSTGWGAVAYSYSIGKYEVTAGQYAAFLNAVAKTDPYGLYNTEMWDNGQGCKISRSGSSGSYRYNVSSFYSVRPVNFVSWGDSLRFANWLHNGQPTGAEGAGTTDTGAYTLGGKTGGYSVTGTIHDDGLLTVTRNLGAKYWLPNENEWCKAAYYKGGGVNAGYWFYPTKTDSLPGQEFPDTGNNANFYEAYFWAANNVDYRNPVGAFTLSPGPYGTFDQGGNVTEWTETNYSATEKSYRGCSYGSSYWTLRADFRMNYWTINEYADLGFRVASVPEPGCIAMLAAAVAACFLWNRKRCRISLIAGLCVLGMGFATKDAAGAYTLANGRRILLNRGLQIEAVTYTSSDDVPGGFTAADYALWKSANFTTFNFWNRYDYYGTNAFNTFAPGQQWSKVWEGHPANPNDILFNAEGAHVNDLVRLQWYDEPDVRTNDIMWQLPQVAAIYRTWNAQFPNTLVSSHFYGLYQVGGTQEGLNTYMQATHPDLLTYNCYPSAFSGGFNFTARDRMTWYSFMQAYRTTALAGYTNPDGSNSGPLAFGQSLDLWRGLYTDAPPSESFVRMQQNASWAFGMTFVSSFCYNEPVLSPPNYPVLFNSSGVHDPNTTVFSYVAETNRQSRNLGPALTRLVNTGIYMKPGSGKTVSGTGITEWTPRAGTLSGGRDYLTSITPYTNSTAFGGTADTNYPDTLIGYSMPLLANNTGFTFVDGLHFMVVNGAATGTAAESAQWYHLTFDFNGSPYDSLIRLSRETGKVELVPLIYTGSLQFYLDLNLPGGTGDLFTFWNSSNPLPTIPEPGVLTMLITGLGTGVFFHVRRRRMAVLSGDRQ